MLQSIVQSLCICGCIYNPLVDVAIGLVWPKLPDDDKEMSKHSGI
jgi:hypothetical protein